MQSRHPKAKGPSLRRFQEHGLSPRCLIFASDTVFFQCATASSWEAWPHLWRHKDVSPLWQSVRRGIGLTVSEYCAVFAAFSTRALTHDADALRAMAGVIRRVSERRGPEFFQDLPAESPAFEACLLFHAGHVVLRRRAAFASYSWAGWQGAIVFFAKHWVSTWIVWYVRRGYEPSKPALMSPTAFEDEADTREDVLRKITGAAAGSYPSEPSDGGGLSFLLADVSHQAPNYDCLQFWTLTAFFRLSKVDVLLGTCHLRGTPGTDLQGEVWLDGFDYNELTHPDDTFEFAVIAQNTTYKERGGTFYIMMLKWHLFAERRGIGHIAGDDLKESLGPPGGGPGLPWKEIILV